MSQEPSKNIITLSSSIAILKLLMEQAIDGVAITASLKLENSDLVVDPIATGRKGFDVLMDLGGQRIQIEVIKEPKTVNARLQELYPPDVP